MVAKRLSDASHSKREIRPVTALFADIVGSTTIAEQLGPEEISQLVTECMNRITRVIEAYGGRVGSFMGDGIAAFFGLDGAHEDDHDRAATAALDVIDLVHQYSRDVRQAWGLPDFNVRIGLDTGMVGVGEVGSDDLQQLAIGDSINVAARLQAAARPGTILVGPNARERLSARFELTDARTLSLKGKSAGIAAAVLQGPRVWPQPSELSPLVGRDHEMDVLRHFAAGLRGGRGQILIIAGEAGIGKSRTLTELRNIWGVEGSWLEGKCMAYGSPTAYRPYTDVLRSWLGTPHGAAEIMVRTRLRARIASLMPDREDKIVPFLGQLLGLPWEPGRDDLYKHLTPEMLGDHIRQAFRDWLIARASREPIVLAIEDLHWADEETRALSEELLGLTDRVSLGIVLSTRLDPGCRGWSIRTQALSQYVHRTLEMPLRALANDESWTLAELIAKDAAPGYHEVIDLAEGNPLFLEELMRVWAQEGHISGRVLPPRVESLLLARIDQLPTETKRFAQIAAVCGRTFRGRVMEIAADTSDIHKHTSIMMRAGLVKERRHQPDSEYSFTHGLLVVAAKYTLTNATLAQYHRWIAEAYETAYARNLDAHLETLATHHEEGGNSKRALSYFERAARRASLAPLSASVTELWRSVRRVAQQERASRRYRAATEAEAEVHSRTGEYREASNLLRALAGSAKTRHERERCLVQAAEYCQRGDMLADAREITRGLAATRLGTRSTEARFRLLRVGLAHRAGRYARMGREIQRIPHLPPEGPTLALEIRRLGALQHFLGDTGSIRQAGNVAGEILKLVGHGSDPKTVIDAATYAAYGLGVRGDLRRARDLFGAAHSLALEMGHKPGVIAISANLCFTHLLLGEVTNARSVGLSCEQFEPHPTASSNLYLNMGHVEMELGRLDRAAHYFGMTEQMARIAEDEENGLECSVGEAAVQAMHGQFDEAAHRLRALSEACAARGGRFLLSWLAEYWLSEIELERGRFDEALLHATRSLEASERAGRHTLPQALRVLGLSLLRENRDDGRRVLRRGERWARAMGMTVECARLELALARSEEATTAASARLHAAGIRTASATQLGSVLAG